MKFVQIERLPWNSRVSFVEVTFGPRASIVLGDPVMLRAEAFGDLIPPQRQGEPLGATAVLATEAAVVEPSKAVLDAPEEATSCSPLRFNAEGSTGAAGRAFETLEASTRRWFIPGPSEDASNSRSQKSNAAA